MFNVIIGCLIANILTIGILGLAIYLVYKKNKSHIDEKVASIKQDINDVYDNLTEGVDKVESTVDSIKDTIDIIKEKLEKLPFSE